MSEKNNPTEAVVPKRLGRYMVRELLGSGTHGSVYKGYDPYVGRMVAIKIEKITESPNEESSIQTHQNLFKEARTTGFLSHPNIVSLYDVGVENNIYFIVMEYVEGNTLSVYCSSENKELSDNPQRVIKIAYDCCIALEYSHTNRVLHRDIKPSNIMLTKEGKPKIMDFSIAHKIQKEAEDQQVIGSPTYMSPEQIQGKALTPATDQFSLAVVIFYVLAKQPPFYNSNIKELFKLILKSEPPELQSLRPDLPKELSLILSKAMSKNPSDRFPNCQTFGSELLALYRSTEKSSLNKSQQHDAISRLAFFSYFNQDEIELFINSSTMVRSNNGDILFQEGQETYDLYVIISGEVDIIKNQTLIATLKSGEVFGEMTFLAKNSNLKRTATAKSRGESLILKIDTQIITNFPIEAQLNYYKVFCENLAYRLSITTSKLASKR
ncbi:MAG: serine/threonine-protein kinase [Methylacidiphilales bacterium]|nr:serine/threonine-protein kinase [Candidatus Methylacidiphilales bacterium]